MGTAAVDRPRTRHSAREPERRAVARAPLLDNGYHLSRAEFHRRYELLPGVKKAELIEGVVFMGSPVSNRHAEATGQVAVFLGTYAAGTPGVRFAENATVLLDADNEVQPDALLRMDSARGGRSKLTDKNYIQGPPELVWEVAVSRVAHDLHDKLNIYRRNQVREYVVWELDANRLDWFVWVEGSYQHLPDRAAGLVCSQVFPGLWLERTALLAGQMSKVLKGLEKGMASAAHREFKKQGGGV